MTRAYSDDLRQRVVASVAAGRSRRATGALFGVSASTVTKWWQLFQATGSVTARRSGAPAKLVLLPARDWLLARIGAAPDLTVRALQAELVARGTPASYGAVWSFLAREGLTFKKKPARRRAVAA
jgi:transposase